MVNARNQLFKGVDNAYQLLRMSDDMNGARRSLVRMLREVASLIEMRQVHPDGTFLDDPDDGELFE
jgi:hypothetical protein